MCGQPVDGCCGRLAAQDVLAVVRGATAVKSESLVLSFRVLGDAEHKSCRVHRTLS